jgi:hypothetical protein
MGSESPVLLQKRLILLKRKRIIRFLFLCNFPDKRYILLGHFFSPEKKYNFYNTERIIAMSNEIILIFQNEKYTNVIMEQKTSQEFLFLPPIGTAIWFKGNRYIVSDRPLFVTYDQDNTPDDDSDISKRAMITEICIFVNGPSP